MPWTIWLGFLGEGISCLEFKLGESEGKWVWHQGSEFSVNSMYMLFEGLLVRVGSMGKVSTN